MSFPEIPDINPDRDLTRDDALNLLLTSIALEEMGLSNLLDAESKKSEAVLKMKDLKQESLKDILGINHSIEKTLQNIIRLSILLQLKLDNAIELMPEKLSSANDKPSESAGPSSGAPENPGTGSDPITNETSAASSSIAYAEPTCTYVDNSDAENNPKKQSSTLALSVKGSYINKNVPLTQGSIIIELDIPQKKAFDQNNKLIYIIQQYNNKCKAVEFMYALPASIRIIKLTPHNSKPTPRNPDITVIKGLGLAMKEDLEYGVIENQTSFILYKIDTGINEIFRMILFSPVSELNHDSGFFIPKNTVLSK